MGQPLELAQPPQSQSATGALRVFLSSTSVDLEAHRARVASLVQSLGQFAVTMNGFPLQPKKDATTVSLDQLRASQVYILLLAWRYGQVPDGQELSVTHQEYREARRLGLPCFVFLADERTNDDFVRFPHEGRDPDETLQNRLLAFRREVQQQQLVGYFTSIDDLVDKVAATLYQYLLDLGRPGRIPRDLLPKVPGFVGREDELARLMITLRQGQHVGLSALVAGLGGVGKSALASEVLQRLSQEASAFPGGITFVRCDGRTGLEGLIWVFDQVLAAWGLRLPAEALHGVSTEEKNVEVRERALRERLGHLPGAALALLDNVELNFPLAQMLDTLTSLGITLLITARHKPFLPSLRLVSLDVLDADSAVQLFRERYADRGGTWDTRRDELATRTVVQRLGCLPLAVELAAARAAVTGMDMLRLADELQQPDVLTRLLDPLNQESTVRYSLERSLALLTPIQQMRFAVLGLPQGSEWPRQIIEALLDAVVTVAPPEAQADVAGRLPPASQAAADLERLAALSLVTLGHPSAPGTIGKGTIARVWLHPLVRMLAVEEWARQPEATQRAGRRGLGRGLRDWVKAHQTEDAETYALLEADETLVVGTLRDVVNSEEMLSKQMDWSARAALNAVIDTVFALMSYLIKGGHWQVGVILWQVALQAARAIGDRADEGGILGNLANLMRELGNYGEARHLYEQALAISRETSNRRNESAWLGNLGDLAIAQGDYEQARELLNQALALKQLIDNRRGVGITLTSLGILAYRQQNYAEAHNFYEQALEIFREVGDQADESIILGNLTELALDEGELTQAHAWLDAALTLARASGSPHVLCFILIEQGTLSIRERHWEQAARSLDEAEALNKRLGSREWEAHILSARARLQLNRGDAGTSRQLFTRALAIFESLGEAFEIQRVREELAALDAPKRGWRWLWSRQKQ